MKMHRMLRSYMCQYGALVISMIQWSLEFKGISTWQELNKKWQRSYYNKKKQNYFLVFLLAIRCIQNKTRKFLIEIRYSNKLFGISSFGTTALQKTQVFFSTFGNFFWKFLLVCGTRDPQKRMPLWYIQKNILWIFFLTQEFYKKSENFTNENTIFTSYTIFKAFTKNIPKKNSKLQYAKTLEISVFYVFKNVEPQRLYFIYLFLWKFNYCFITYQKIKNVLQADLFLI